MNERYGVYTDLEGARRTLKEVRHAIRNPYAWPGGYPVYVFLEDGAMLCTECARANYRLISRSTHRASRDGWKAGGADVHWEGAPERCDQCGKELPSAYGEQEEDEA